MHWTTVVNQAAVNRNVFRCFVMTESELQSRMFDGRLFTSRQGPDTRVRTFWVDPPEKNPPIKPTKNPPQLKSNFILFFVPLMMKYFIVLNSFKPMNTEFIFL